MNPELRNTTTEARSGFEVGLPFTPAEVSFVGVLRGLKRLARYLFPIGERYAIGQELAQYRSIYPGISLLEVFREAQKDPAKIARLTMTRTGEVPVIVKHLEARKNRSVRV